MEQQFLIHGMNCSSCKAIIEYSLKDIQYIQKAEVDLEAKTLGVISERTLDPQTLEQHLPEKYSLELVGAAASTPPTEFSPETSKVQQLKPLFLIFFYLFAASVGMHLSDWNTGAFMLDFMGLFYIVFSFFKFLDLRGFAQSFPMYDPLAKALPLYAWVYPFIETLLGVSFLSRTAIDWALWATLVVLGITTLGVLRVLLNKQQIRCACLGTVLQLPMTEATLIENILMIGMALGMISGI